MSGKLMSLIVVLLFASVALKEVQHITITTFGKEESITLTNDELYLTSKTEKEGVIVYSLTYPASLGSKKDNVKFVVTEKEDLPNDDTFVKLTNCTEVTSKGETVLGAGGLVKKDQYSHIKYENFKAGDIVRVKVDNVSTGTMIGVVIGVILALILICVIVACIIKKCCC